MTILSFDDFAELLDKAVNRIPPRFCRGLTGGFNVQKPKKRDGQYYVLGEYIEGDHLGSFIVFYYGSFVEVLEDEPLEVWEAEIIDTLLHELQHHLESLAGREDLARSEMEELARALRQA
jgi:hypothetical protein